MKKFTEKCRIAENDYSKLFLLSMFEYENLPETLWSEAIEYLLMFRRGMVGIGYVTDRSGNKILSAVDVNRSGDVNQYGVGKQLIGANPYGTLNGTIGVDVVLGWNNALCTPCRDIEVFSNIKSDILVSEKLNVIYSRLLPIISVSDNKQKIAIDHILKGLIDGTMATSVISDNITSIIEGVHSIETTQISDVKMSEYIQYLSRYNDDISKRFYTRYGHALQTQNKSAQQTNDEIHGMDSTSWVLPCQMLKYRKRMVEEVNEMFDTNISVDFSDVWKHEYDRYMNVTSADSSADTSADTSADSSADSSAE